MERIEEDKMDGFVSLIDGEVRCLFFAFGKMRWEWQAQRIFRKLQAKNRISRQIGIITSISKLTTLAVKAGTQTVCGHSAGRSPAQTEGTRTQDEDVLLSSRRPFQSLADVEGVFVGFRS